MAVITPRTACGFDLGIALGSGSCGTVYLAAKMNGYGYVYAAVKVAPKKAMASLKREASALKQLSHPSIIPFIAFAETEDQAALAIKYCVDGDLLQLLNAHRGICEPLAARLFVQICDALLAAHAAGWAHRDVKPENILLEGERAYLADWGLAFYSPPDGTVLLTIGKAGSKNYAAPEAYANTPVNSFLLDSWSFGATLFVTCSATLPFNNDTDHHCTGPLVLPKMFSSSLCELLMGCLAPASSRWTMMQIRKCAWFARLCK